MISPPRLSLRVTVSFLRQLTVLFLNWVQTKKNSTLRLASNISFPFLISQYVFQQLLKPHGFKQPKNWRAYHDDVNNFIWILRKTEYA